MSKVKTPIAYGSYDAGWTNKVTTSNCPHCGEWHDYDYGEFDGGTHWGSVVGVTCEETEEDYRIKITSIDDGSPFERGDYIGDGIYY